MNRSIQKVCLISGGAIGGCFAVGVSFTMTFFSLAKGALPSVPPLEARQQLASKTLQDINRAVQGGDFASFRSTLSPIWQSQATAQQLEQMLDPLVVSKVDFSNAEEVNPIFDGEPSIDHRGVLILAGEFPTQPLRAMFEFSYYHHKSGWKLIGFDVKRKAHPMPVPSNRELTRISELTLRDFDTAIKSGDFSKFHSNLASLFRKKSNPDTLREAFSVFVTRQINLKPDGDFDLVFDAEPTMNSQGILSVQGHYNTRLSKVDFTFDYLPEEQEWKLLEIKVAANPR